MTVLAAADVGEFGIVPKVALLSHSNFGRPTRRRPRKMRRALALLRERAPELEVDGEMHGRPLCRAIRNAAFPNSRLKGQANLLVMPTLDAANIAFKLLNAARRRTNGRADPARAAQAGACPDPDGHGARDRQYERVRRGRRAGRRRSRPQIVSAWARGAQDLYSD